MKLKFKKQDYQTQAVKSVVGCFKGQPKKKSLSFRYRIDPGTSKAGLQGYRSQSMFEKSGFKNSDLALTQQQMLENIQQDKRIIEIMQE